MMTGGECTESFKLPTATVIENFTEEEGMPNSLEV